MLDEGLTVQLLVQCQNVICGAKLASEIHYVLKNESTEDILFFDRIIKGNWPELNYMITYHPDKEAAKDGHKSVIIYKYKGVCGLFNEIEKLDRDSSLYHFANGKMFGYNDYEVMKFIQKNKT